MLPPYSTMAQASESRPPRSRIDDDPKSITRTTLIVKNIPRLREQWLEKIKDLTGPVPQRLPPWRAINHEINLVDPTLVVHQRRPTCPDVLRTQLADKIDWYLKAGWWEAKSVTNASPMLCIHKRNGVLRSVIDARIRNLNTIPDVTPLPDQDLIRQDCALAIYISKLDLKDAFEQVRIVAAHVDRSAFSTTHGTMVSHVAQQGDRNVPSTFQRLMTHIFHKSIGRYVNVYLDDIFIFSLTLEDHEDHLEEVFQLLRDNALYLSAAKVDLYSERMDCLGHIIDQHGVHASADKMRVIREWPTPTCYHDIQRFLGLVNYISQFMPDVSAYTSPLSAMSKQRHWTWNPLHESCLAMIKQLACRAPILQPIDFDHMPAGHRLWVICDASISGVGAYYGQGPEWKFCRPAGFLSKKFSTAQLSYRTYEQETIAILEALSLWEDKLIGRRCTVITDHRTLEFFQTQATISRRQVRWIEFLSRFDYEVIYVKGEENIVADAFSRYYSATPEGTIVPWDQYVHVDERLDPDGEDLPMGRLIESRAASLQKAKPAELQEIRARESAELVANRENTDKVAVNLADNNDIGLSVWESQGPDIPLKIVLIGENLLDVLRAAYPADKVYGKVLENPSHHPQFRVAASGVIYTRNTVQASVICIPKSFSKGRRVTEIIIDNAHRIIGHHALRRTSQYIRRWYWWSDMIKDLESFCKSCGICQTTKSSTALPHGIVHSLPVPTRPWQSIGMDFFGPFPTVEGFDYLLLVICRLTSMVHLLPTKTTATAGEIATLFLKEIVRLHGLPGSIVSDRDPKFISKFWRELHRLMGTKLLMSTAYHPQTDGASERGVRHASGVIRTLIEPNQLDWVNRVAMGEFAINSCITASTEFAPFELNYGWLPTILPDSTETPFVGVQQFAEQALMNLSAAHDAIIANRVYQAHQANKHRREDPGIKIGDKMYLSTADLNLPKGRARKLMPKFIGPYPVTKSRPETSNYTLELSPELVRRRIHPTFHISRLRIHVPNDDDRFPNREVATYYDFGDDPEVEWSVDEIIGHRWVKKNKLEIQVRWNAGDTTWEPVSEMLELQALDDYLVLRGVTTPEELPRRR